MDSGAAFRITKTKRQARGVGESRSLFNSQGKRINQRNKGRAMSFFPRTSAELNAAEVRPATSEQKVARLQ